MADGSKRHRVMVTGGNGFVGRYLVRALAAHHDVASIIVAGLGDRAPPQERVKQIPLDITDAAATESVIGTERPTHLFHLAAMAAVGTAQRNIRQTWAINFSGAQNVALAVAGASPDTRLIHISSAEVYGESFRAGAPLTEDAPFEPVNCYGASKAAADLMIGQMVKDGLRAIRMRPFNHTGRGQSEDFVVPAFAAQIARIERHEQPPVIMVGNIETRRDLLDVEDVVEAYVAAMERFDTVPPGAAFNVASGRALRIRDILDALTAMSTIPIDIREDPARLRSGDMPIVVGDASRARSLLGWTPQRRIEATLASVLAQYRERH